MNELIGILTDDEDMCELINVLEPRRAAKRYKKRDNHFRKWNDLEFIARFRLSKAGVTYVVDKIRDEICSPTQRNNAVSPEDMVLVTLRFFATGSFLQVTGDFAGIDKSTTSRIIHKVSRAIARLHENFIKMPSTEEELRANSQEFYNISRFPSCIGALDCTHIKIISPGGREPEIYRNRKHFFSINVQAICDSKCRFQNLVCRWAGSVHDSTIFNNSRVRAKFETGNFGKYVLVGDGGYGIRSYLITPLHNPTTPAERLFNEAQIRTRNPIERCFGTWKRRFPILAFGIRLKLNRVEAIIVATAVLHNIACLLKDELPPITVEEEAAINFVNNFAVDHILDNNQRINNNNVTRYQMINNFFNNLL